MNGTKMLKPHWSFTLTTLEFTMEKINSCGVRAHCEEGIILSSCHEKIFSIQNSNVVCPKLECGLRCLVRLKIHFFSRGVARCIYIGDLHSNIPWWILMRSGAEVRAAEVRAAEVRAAWDAIPKGARRCHHISFPLDSIVDVIDWCLVDDSWY